MGPHLGTLSAWLRSEAALAVYVFPLVMAAVSDLYSLRIPNWLTGALLLAFPVMALLVGHDVAWMSHLLAGLCVFAVCAVMFALQWMGGGDVKLLAATAVWIGLGQLLPFLTLVAIVGGVFALILVILRHHVMQATFLATLRRLPSFAQEKMPIPYGVPIAVAGIIMGPSLPLMV